MKNCKCHTPPILFSDYSKKNIGIDETYGRFGEVSVEKCKYCDSFWLNYSVEYESSSKSAKWYRGMISKDELHQVTPENSIEYLNSMDWYIFGGSYFKNAGKIGRGNVNVDF